MSIIRNSPNCTCSCRFRGAPWLDQLSRWSWMHRHCGSCGGETGRVGDRSGTGGPQTRARPRVLGAEPHLGGPQSRARPGVLGAEMDLGDPQSRA